MRRSVEDTAETRRLILNTAAREFRKHGEKVGLSDLMKAAGLTQGGFYRHFASKDELFAESLSLALEQLGDKLEQALHSDAQRSLAVVIETYLSSSHRDNLGGGCALAALGSEIARAPKKVRGELMGSYRRIVDIIAQCIPGAKGVDRRADAEFILSSMAGAVTLSRVVCDKAASTKMLDECASRLLSLYS